MTMRARRWPSGTGQWSRIRTVIVAADEDYRSSIGDQLDGDTAVVATPLEVISRLEDTNSLISTVVLVDPVVHRDLAAFLTETYPWVAVVLGSPAITADRTVPPDGEPKVRLMDLLVAALLEPSHE